MQMEKFERLQELLLNMTNEKDLNKVFNFISKHKLSIDDEYYFYVLILISSISYSRYELYDNIIILLKQLPTIKINQSFRYRYLSDDEVKKRLYHLKCLLLGSNNFSFDSEKYMFSDIRRKENKIPLFSAIQNDDAEELQKIISKNNIEFNKIFYIGEPLYRYDYFKSMILLEYAAFLGSINCFKYLLMNTNYTNYNKLLKFSIMGGNMDIIHITERYIDNIENNKNILYLAILYMHNELIEYIVDIYDIKIDAECYIKCIYSSNYIGFKKLMEIEDMNALKTLSTYGSIGSTPLDIAAFEGNCIFFQYLKNLDFIMIYNSNSYGKNVLHSATRNYQIYIIKYIINNRLIDPDESYFSPKEMASIYFYNEEKRILMDIFDKYNIKENEPISILNWIYDENYFIESEKNYIKKKRKLDRKFNQQKSSSIKITKRKNEKSKKLKYSWKKLVVDEYDDDDYSLKEMESIHFNNEEELFLKDTFDKFDIKENEAISNWIYDENHFFESEKNYFDKKKNLDKKFNQKKVHQSKKITKRKSAKSKKLKYSWKKMDVYN